MEPCSRSTGGRRLKVNQKVVPRTESACISSNRDAGEKGGTIANEIERVVGWGTDSRDNYGEVEVETEIGNGEWGMTNWENRKERFKGREKLGGGK